VSTALIAGVVVAFVVVVLIVVVVVLRRRRRPSNRFDRCSQTYFTSCISDRFECRNT